MEIKEICKELGRQCYSFVRSFYLIFRYTGLLLVECFKWVARLRCKAPVFSLLVELFIFFVVVLLVFTVYYSRAKIKEDQLGILRYQLEEQYKDSLIKAEIEGYDMAKRDFELKKEKGN